MKKHFPITSNSKFTLFQLKLFKIGMLISIRNNSNAKLIFFEFTTVKLTPFNYRTFSMVNCLEIIIFKSIRPASICFLLVCKYLLGQHVLEQYDRPDDHQVSLLFPGSLGFQWSNCRCLFFNRFVNSCYGVWVIDCNNSDHMPFHFNFLSYCRLNCNVCCSCSFYFLMVPRVSMIPVNILILIY
jgi:hypothetical protein